jgi:aquaporin Z
MSPANRGETAARRPGESLRRVAAEAFGSFALVFAAAGADTMAQLSGGQVTPAARAAAPALMVTAMIYSIGDVSGAHLNPAVTLAFAAKRLFPWRWMAPYWIGQLGGAVAAAALLRLLFGDAAGAGVSTPHIPSVTAAALEAVLALILVTVILGSADRYRVVGPDAALAVGATIALCGLIALPVEGASMNPARSLGPALVEWRLGDVWIYVVGPPAGALLAALLTRLLHGPTENDPETEHAARGRA